MSSVQKATYLPLVLELLVTLCAGQQLVLGGAGHLVYWLQGDWGWLVEKMLHNTGDINVVCYIVLSGWWAPLELHWL